MSSTSPARHGPALHPIATVLLPFTAAFFLQELYRVAGAVMAPRLVDGFSLDAREIGLLNAVVAPDELEATVQRYTDAVLAGGPGALAGTKELLTSTLDDSVARYEALLELSARQFDTPEAREGARAFAEKRPPAWRDGAR